jgi:DNA-binding MurR/RpiR family transcriptional regulator
LLARLVRIIANTARGQEAEVAARRSEPGAEFTGGVLGRLGELRSSMSGALAQVADYITAEPATAMRSTITELAVSVGTSPGTITRFCRACGFSGYAELRVAIAEDIGRAGNRRWDSDIGREIDVSDRVDHVVKVIVSANQRALIETAEQLDLTALDEVAKRLVAARQIHIFGVGTSGIAAAELQVRLQRIAVPCWSWDEIHGGLTAISLVDERDIVVGISQSGSVVETLEVVRCAAERGATTVALTNNPASPLAKTAGLRLTTAPRADAFRADAMADRHAQLLLLDVIYARVAQLTHARTLGALETTAEALDTHRVAPAPAIGRKRSTKSF